MQTDRPLQSPRLAAHLMLLSYRRTQCLGVAADLRLFDRLDLEPKTAGELAHECGVDPRSLRRLVRALVAMDLLVEDGEGRLRATPIGMHFTSDQLGPLARYVTAPPAWRAWSRLGDSIRTGERGFDLEFGMRDWDFYAANPDAGAIFDGAMRALTSPAAAAIIAAHDFSGYKRVADIGGGDGSLLIAILSAHPGVEGILFDRPGVVERAAPRLRETGLGDRCQAIAGSFFEEVPGGADAYVMKWILHDWEDRDAQRILAACRRAMATGADLIVVERVAPERVRPGDLELVLADLHMMVMNGGLERTESEFRELLAGAGFRLAAITDTGTPVSVLRAVAV
jgi:O-methyltransferase/methyltransferase family protein